jgi:pimeloyl-ACP methyl ester carboxylesterase
MDLLAVPPRVYELLGSLTSAKTAIPLVDVFKVETSFRLLVWSIDFCARQLHLSSARWSSFVYMNALATMLAASPVLLLGRGTPVFVALHSTPCFLVSAIVSAAFGSILKQHSPLPAWRFYACVTAISYSFVLCCGSTTTDTGTGELGETGDMRAQEGSFATTILESFRGPNVRVDLILLLAALRLLFSSIRVGLLLPAICISRCLGSPPKLHRLHRLHGTDVKLSQLASDGSVTIMRKSDIDFRISRVRLVHVDAAVIEHPLRTDKWVLLLPGNGEALEIDFDSKLELARRLGCSIVACDVRDVGRSGGVLLSADGMVDDAAACVRYCEARVKNPADDILVFGHSMGGGVATELVARRFPHLSLVNERSFSSLGHVATEVLSSMLGARILPRWLVSPALAVFFSRVPWRTPLDSIGHWHRVPAGRKLVVYSPEDQVIGRAGIYNALREAGTLDGTDVICLRMRKGGDPHNGDTRVEAPYEHTAQVNWMRQRLRLHD